MSVAHLIIRGGTGADDPTFFQAFEALENRLNAEHVEFANPRSTQSEVQTVQIWPIDGCEAEVRVYDNHIANVRHVEIEAKDDTLLDKLTSAAREELPVEDHGTLVHSWLGASVDQPNVLVKIALSAPGHLASSAFSAIGDGLEDPSPNVRCMAAYAMALHGDPRFEALLRLRLPNETDENTRNIIERALWMYDNA